MKETMSFIWTATTDPSMTHRKAYKVLKSEGDYFWFINDKGNVSIIPKDYQWIKLLPRLLITPLDKELFEIETIGYRNG